MNAPKFGELERVRLKEDIMAFIKKDKLGAGTEGTVVFAHDGGEAYEVEFADEEGNTIAVVTLPESALEATGKTDP